MQRDRLQLFPAATFVGCVQSFIYTLALEIAAHYADVTVFFAQILTHVMHDGAADCQVQGGVKRLASAAKYTCSHLASYLVLPGRPRGSVDLITGTWYYPAASVGQRSAANFTPNALAELYELAFLQINTIQYEMLL